MRRQKHRRPRRPTFNLSRKQLRPRDQPRPGTELPPPAPLPDFSLPNIELSTWIKSYFGLDINAAPQQRSFYDAIIHARKMVEQQQRIIYRNARGNWGSWVTENTMAIVHLPPYEPGPQAEDWLRLVIEEDGVDYVFDRWHKCYLEKVARHQELSQTYGLDPDSVLLGQSMWDEQLQNLTKEINFAKWVVTHDLMESIAC